jgi:hypothetical protein
MDRPLGLLGAIDQHCEMPKLEFPLPARPRARFRGLLELD